MQHGELPAMQKKKAISDASKVGRETVRPHKGEQPPRTHHGWTVCQAEELAHKRVNVQAHHQRRIEQQWLQTVQS